MAIILKIVVSLGGNALAASKDKKVTYLDLIKNIKKTMESISILIKNKNQISIVFGSGPQIGALVLQNEIAKNAVSPMPLNVLDAELEGELGYLIEQSLQNELRKKKIHRHVVSILTQVVVSKKDSAFRKPTKPIGPYYNRKEAEVLKRKGYAMGKINGGWRRVVASPKPFRIVEASIIKKLASMGVITIAAGGGGIPVYESKGLRGVDAVIDKDLASACLASSIGAGMLLIITDVDAAYLNYRKTGQKRIPLMKVHEARKYMKEGHFPAGSMGPKIEAAINFIGHGGRKAIITNTSRMKDAIKGKAGTLITQ